MDNILVYHTPAHKSSEFLVNLSSKAAYDKRSFFERKIAMTDADRQSCEALISDWLTVEGDLDDFIFYSECEQVSEK